MKNVIPLFWVIVCILTLCLILVFLPYDQLHGLELFGYHLNIEGYDKLGTFVGGITTPVISLAALVLLYITYQSQKEELQLSRDEVVQSREVFAKQQFESSFFQLLNVHLTIVNSLSDQGKGKAYFVELKNDLGNVYNKTARGTIAFRVEEAIDSYSIIYNRNKDELAYYFRILYRLFKLIDSSANIDKSFYAKIIRAQLSESELLLLFYNSKTKEGDRFQSIIIDYNLLKHLPGFEKIELRKFKTLINPLFYSGNFPESSISGYESFYIPEVLEKRHHLYEALAHEVYYLVKEKKDLEPITVLLSASLSLSFLPEEASYFVYFEINDIDKFGKDLQMGRDELLEFLEDTIRERLLYSFLNQNFDESSLIVRSETEDRSGIPNFHARIKFYHEKKVELLVH